MLWLLCDCAADGAQTVCQAPASGGANCYQMSEMTPVGLRWDVLGELHLPSIVEMKDSNSLTLYCRYTQNNRANEPFSSARG